MKDRKILDTGAIAAFNPLKAWLDNWRRFLDNPFAPKGTPKRLHKPRRAKGRDQAPDPEELECRRLVEAMTNWQRNQWAKAGYPGRKAGRFSPDRIRPFVRIRA